MRRDKQDKIVTEAKKRFKRARDYEADFRRLFVDDLKFANADSDNGWQWPDALRKSRDFDSRPCLTINKTRQHVLQIVNDAKENKPSVTIHPVSSEATYETAEILEGCIRHIEYNSNAQVAYDTATEHQVSGGIGYWRVVTDYANDESFDQEIFIRRIKDALCVILDPDIKEADGSDARYGFVFTDMSHDEFKLKYPDHEDLLATSPLGDGDDWLSKDNVRVCEYYRREVTKDKLYVLPMPDGSYQMQRASQMSDEMREIVKADRSIQSRPIDTVKVRWYLIAGSEVLEDRDWPGKYIPIVRVVGEETIIEGKLDRKGHVRALKDPQRMYNYWSSSAVEFVALQGKQPYIAPIEAIEGFEKYWETANQENYSYLPYNALDENGQPIERPVRQQPPIMAQGYLNGMQNAAEEMRMVSGQYDPSLGANPQDQSGVALQAQQRRGDRATYHYIDNLSRAIRFTGKILIDLIPKVYDTPRVLRILGQDGSEDQVQLDPNAQQSYQERQVEAGKVQKIFNPSLGLYDVVSDTGPSYQTQRQAAFQSISQIIAQQPEALKIVGDLLFKAADFPMADEIAERLSRMVPAQLKQDGPPPEVMQAQQQIQQMQQQMAAMQKALHDKQQDYALRAAKDQSDGALDEYRAETDRMKVLGPAFDPAQLESLVRQLVSEAMQGMPTQAMQ